MKEEFDNRDSCSIHEVEDVDVHKQHTPASSSMQYINMNDVTRDGPTCRALFQNSVEGLNETCPHRGIIYTQNVQSLSGKDRRQGSLIDPIIDLMITESITIYIVYRKIG